MRRWFDRLIPSRPEPEQDKTSEPEPVRFPFSDIEGVMALYVTALSGGTLRVASSGSASGGSYTDGRTIYFPLEVRGFDERDDSRRLYRIIAAWKVLQARTGALDIRPLPDAPNPFTSLAFYEVIHGEWLDRQLVQTWPGLAGDLALLRRDALGRRNGTSATAQPLESLLTGLLSLPLETDGFAQLAQQSEIAQLGVSDLDGALREAFSASDPGPSRRLALELSRTLADADTDGALQPVHYRGRIRFDLIRTLDFDLDAAEGTATSAPPPPQRRGDPILVDARTSEQRIVRERRASRGGRQSIQLSIGDREPSLTFKQVPLSPEEKAGALLYDEWDYRLDEFMREWVAVRLRHPRGGNSEAVEKILRQYAPLITRIKQQFELLRPERLRLTRQYDGDDIDLNAMVEAHADHYAGFSPTEKLYSRTLERERNIALGCLIDLSGSTGAWIDDDPRNDQVIEVTRRAIVFLCEALTMLDDRYAIYGFTSSTRKRCDITVVKGFDEQYGETVKGRMSGLTPGSYTRIGPAVRHTTRALIQQPARVRLLLLISDGRPNDFDGYGGRYGIEDTRKALIEARQSGVSTFALTIDAEARDYMPYMFGRNHYVVVENAPALALKLSDVYRRLTIQ